MGMKKHKRAELLIVTSALAEILGSGYTLEDALRVMEGDGNDDLSLLVAGIRKSVERGTPFVTALEAAFKDLPPFYRGLARSGVRGGTAAASMKGLAKWLEEEERAANKARDALIYPAIILACIVIAALLVAFILLPMFSKLALSMGAAATEAVSSMVIRLRITVAIFLACIVILIALTLSVRNLAKKNEHIRIRLDAFALALPLIGDAIWKREMYAFSFAASLLISGGVPTAEVVSEAAESIANLEIRDRARKAARVISKGSSVSGSFSAFAALPEFAIRWLAIGERTGKPEPVFARLKEHYKGEYERSIDQFIALFEPLTSVVIGAIILLAAVLFIAPIFDLYSLLLA
jgi:type II secretory pathway component PulF